MRVTSLVSKCFLGLGIAALVATAGFSTGAFTTADLDRLADVQTGEDESALVGLVVAEEISVACSEELVTVTNNFNDPAEFEVAIPESRDGDPALSERAEGEDSLGFALNPGESKVVYVTGVRGPPHDDVSFEITATSDGTSVTLSESVPKVPGNEDGDGERADDCRDDGDGPPRGDDGDDGNDNDGDDDDSGPPPWIRR